MLVIITFDDLLVVFIIVICYSVILFDTVTFVVVILDVIQRYSPRFVVPLHCCCLRTRFIVVLGIHCVVVVRSSCCYLVFDCSGLPLLLISVPICCSNSRYLLFVRWRLILLRYLNVRCSRWWFAVVRYVATVPPVTIRCTVPRWPTGRYHVTGWRSLSLVILPTPHSGADFTVVHHIVELPHTVSHTYVHLPFPFVPVCVPPLPLPYSPLRFPSAPTWFLLRCRFGDTRVELFYTVRCCLPAVIPFTFDLTYIFCSTFIHGDDVVDYVTTVTWRIHVPTDTVGYIRSLLFWKLPIPRYRFPYDFTPTLRVTTITGVFWLPFVVVGVVDALVISLIYVCCTASDPIPTILWWFYYLVFPVVHLRSAVVRFIRWILPTLVLLPCCDRLRSRFICYVDVRCCSPLSPPHCCSGDLPAVTTLPTVRLHIVTFLCCLPVTLPEANSVLYPFTLRPDALLLITGDCSFTTLRCIPLG